jgi:hypothetical protein
VCAYKHDARPSSIIQDFRMKKWVNRFLDIVLEKAGDANE